MEILMKLWGLDLVALRGFVFSIFILNFVFSCQILFLQPLVAALDGQPSDAAALFERASQSIKVKKYSEALDDLNAAIETDPGLSEAYWHRASILRRFCRLDIEIFVTALEENLNFVHEHTFLFFFLFSLPNMVKVLCFDIKERGKIFAWCHHKVIARPNSLKAAFLERTYTRNRRNLYAHIVFQSLCFSFFVFTGALLIFLIIFIINLVKRALDKIENEYILQKVEIVEINDTLEGRRLRWLGLSCSDLKKLLFTRKIQLDMNIREALMRAERSLKLSQRKDYYKILGILKTASMSEIKRAYKKLALQWHPDKNADNRAEAEAKFQEIAAAYEILGDEEKRTKYDSGEDIDEGMGMGGGGFNPFGGGGQQYTFHFEGGFPGGGFGGFHF
ncbi:dnaJ P58IPK homolog [Olea europaea subsp. europaea]|uniref:DnaJ P58IPK homolog n=1 Tax=Olea europaea subsp. europaea TaxID=158383 RepID=A0A8S0PHL5_OLEEU|nr:dnaJ P58IPK homolog [Olea europaea subsp. europaea]